MTVTRSSLMLAIALGSSMLATGCTQPPRGSSSGRIPPSVTTRAEINDPSVLPVTITEFSDQLAMEIVEDLVKHPNLAPPGKRYIMAFGDINNKTGIVPSTDFEYIRSRTRSALLKSEFVRSKVMFVESRGRMAQLAAREGIGTPENPAGPEAYDPAATYLLNGDFIRVQRGSTHLYYMEYQLVHSKTNEIVFSSSTEEKKVPLQF